MNLLDVAIIGATIAAGIGGWRLGLVARVFAWAGVFTGLALAVNFVPRVVTGLGGATTNGRVGAAFLFLLLAASIGQAVGLVIGLLVHRVFPLANPLPLWDRIAGASVGSVGLIVLTWIAIPSLATAQGWPARESRGSWVVATIERYAPSQPSRFAAWGLAVSQAPYPSALDPLANPPNPGTAPSTVLSAPLDAAVRRAVVQVAGEACHEIQDGSGWVAAPGLVMTNAHVVAGERSTSIIDAIGVSHRAVVVEFDPVRDLAVLSVPGFDATPLPLRTAAVGDVGVVYGHPGGGPLKRAPARLGAEIEAVGTNIYRTAPSRRHVFVLAASLAPGDSGAPVVNTKGEVIAAAFAIDPGRSGTAYALTDAEIRPIVEHANSNALADTGGCLVE